MAPRRFRRRGVAVLCISSLQHVAEAAGSSRGHINRAFSYDDPAELDADLEEDLGFNVVGQSGNPWKEKAVEHGSFCLAWVRRWTRGRYEDWLFLSLLGTLMGIYSFGIDVAVQSLHNFRLDAFRAAGDLSSRMVVWYTLTAGIATCAALFIAWFIPSATGSGFPEMKAYLQGVKMKNTFSPLTCIGKIIFLPVTLCTELPLGKEGPVTHVAAVFALFITKVFKDISADELERHTGNELVAAACTMGAAVCYGAPVGGVLFSIEATRAYFAVRNYWRGFFAAVCGTLVYKYLSQMYHETDILPMYHEDYTQPLPFNLEFLAISVAIGLLCGVVGPAFVWAHRQLLKGLKRLEGISSECLCRSPKPKPSNKEAPNQETCCSGLPTHRVTVFRVLYTILVCVVVAGLMMPWSNGYSPVMSHISTRQQLTDLMANVSWEERYEKSPGVFCPPGMGVENCTALLESNRTASTTPRPPEPVSPRLLEIVDRWTGQAGYSYQTVLLLYILYYYFGTLVCTTLTLPSGALIPIFKVGVAMGRLLGEYYCSYRLAVCLPNLAIPSGFACMVGAALCASVTHAISISVIVFELTGQITYVLPILTTVLVSNALSRHLQPSMYDSLIKVKKITVLPKMRLSNIPGGYANVTARDVMTSDFSVLPNRISLNTLRKLVHNVKTPSKVLPLVDTVENMEPLGLVHVRRIRHLLREELGQVAWTRERPRFYLTMNAFKTLDWQSVRNTSTVGNLDLEVAQHEEEGCSPGSSQAHRGGTSGVTEKPDGVRVDAYCTVNATDNLKVRWSLVRQNSIVPKRPVCLDAKPRRSALKSMSCGLATTPEHEPAPVAEEEEVVSAAPPTRSHLRRSSRFSVERVAETELSTAAPEKVEACNYQCQAASGSPMGRSCSSETEDSGRGGSPPDSPGSSHPSVSSRDSLSSLSDSPSSCTGARRRVRLPPVSTVIEGTTGAAERDTTSLASDAESITAAPQAPAQPTTNKTVGGARMKERPPRRLQKKEKATSEDHDDRPKAMKKRLMKQFSMSDLYNRDGDDSNPNPLNVTDIIQKTLQRTSDMLTSIRSPTKDRLEEDKRLQRLWRRQQLSRVLELDQVIEVEPFPLSVTVETPLVQVHRMFAMLCAHKMYVMDRRRLVGCLSLQRLSEFITGGQHEAALAATEGAVGGVTDPTPESGYDTVGSEARPLSDFGSQDTLDGLGEEVFDSPDGATGGAAVADGAHMV